jgi:hypothetical protein
MSSLELYDELVAGYFAGWEIERATPLGEIQGVEYLRTRAAESGRGHFPMVGLCYKAVEEER